MEEVFIEVLKEYGVPGIALLLSLYLALMLDRHVRFDQQFREHVLKGQEALLNSISEVSEANKESTKHAADKRSKIHQAVDDLNTRVSRLEGKIERNGGYRHDV